MDRTVDRKVFKICSQEVLLVSNQSVSCGVKSRVREDHSSTVRHRCDRETSSAVQWVDFDGVGLDQLLRRQCVTSRSSRHWVVSAVRRVGGSYPTVCVGSASSRRFASAVRCVASHLVGIRSADFGGTTVC